MWRLLWWLLKLSYRILACTFHAHKTEMVSEKDALAIASLAVSQAQLQISSQIQTDVGRIATSVAFMGVDLTALTLLAALQAIVGSRWWWPAIPLSVSAVAFFASVLGEELEPGPPIRDFIEAYGERPALEAYTAMLSQLVAATEENAQTTVRAFWSAVGYIFSAIAVVVAVVAFAIYPAFFSPRSEPPRSGALVRAPLSLHPHALLSRHHLPLILHVKLTHHPADRDRRTAEGDDGRYV